MVNLYNEGRVVGYSAYEIYVRHHISHDPDTPPASEIEWLASTISIGSSLLIKIDNVQLDEDGYWIKDYILPETSTLCAANTIIGSYFRGSGISDEHGFCTKVTSYGPLIENNDTNSLADNSSTPQDIPIGDVKYSKTEIAQISGYCQIIDGVVVQHGKWTATADNQPKKDLAVNFDHKPFIRICGVGDITEPFYLLLSGFTQQGVISGVSGLDGSTEAINYANGTYLGPAQVPWGNKIIFTLPSCYSALFEIDKYVRRLPTTREAQIISDKPIIDMRSEDISQFYADFRNYGVNVDVVRSHSLGTGTAVLCTYNQNIPTIANGLYGNIIVDTGIQTIYPIDCHAPGNPKIFADSELYRAIDYKTAFPSNIVYIQDNNNILYEILSKDLRTPLVSIQPWKSIVDDMNVYTNHQTVGRISSKSIALTDDNGADLDLSGSDGTLDVNEDSTISWQRLLQCLGNNKSLDVLGSTLSELKQALIEIAVGGTSDKQYVIKWDGDKIYLAEVDNKFPNFFLISLECRSTNSEENPYSKMYIDVFGFTSLTSSQIVNTVGSITQYADSDLDVTSKNWFQKFQVENMSELTELIKYLEPGVPDKQYNTLKINIVPRCGYVSAYGNVNNGAPRSNTTAQMAAYIQTSTGKGICYVLPAPNTASLASGSYICSMSLTNESYEPDYDRSGWYWEL